MTFNNQSIHWKAN